MNIPFGSIETFSDKNLSYFIELGNEAGFLSIEDRPEIDHLLYTPDLTFLAPNSAQALVDFKDANVTGLNSTMLGLWFDYHFIDQLIYSTGFVNGTQLTTVAGLPLLVTLNNGDIYINDAKITGRDNLVVNGVFHVIDESVHRSPGNHLYNTSANSYLSILTPNNITRPTFATNNSTSPISPPASPPVNSGTNLSQPSSLQRGAKIGIGVGIGIAAIGMIFALISVYRRKMRRDSVPSFQGNQETRSWNTSMKPAEMGSSSLHELAQLETMERAVELPAKHEHLFEIGRAF